MNAVFSVLNTASKAVIEEFDIDTNEDSVRLAEYGVDLGELAGGDVFEFGPDEASGFAEDFGLEVSAPDGYSGKLSKGG